MLCKFKSLSLFISLEIHSLYGQKHGRICICMTICRAGFATVHSTSELRCEVQKFISEFTSRFVTKGCDWLPNSMKPIKCLVYKPACEFRNELLNFGTNFRTSQRSSEYYSEKLSEIDCNGSATWNSKRTKPFDQSLSKFVEVKWPKELIILGT